MPRERTVGVPPQLEGKEYFLRSSSAVIFECLGVMRGSFSYTILQNNKFHWVPIRTLRNWIPWLFALLKTLMTAT